MLRTNPRHNLLGRILIPILGVALTSLLKETVEYFLGNGPPLIFFYPAVIFSAMTGGLWSGLFCMALAMLTSIYFFMGPWFDFAVGSPNDVFRLILFFFTSIGLSWAFEVVNRQRFKLFLLDQSKERFIGILCHELRIPMNRTYLQLRALLGDPATPAAIRPQLNKLLQDADLENLLVQEVLLSVKAGHRKWSLKREMLNLDLIIRQAMDYVSAEAEDKNIHIEYASHTHPVFVFADKTAMMQLLWNLLRNAVKFSPISGRVVVEVAQDDSSTATIRVIDKGRGIEPSKLTQIFEPYEQAKLRDASDHLGGLGLGLWICRTITAAHAGTIEAQSEGVGKGTTVTVRMPTAQRVTPDHYEWEPYESEIPATRKPVLLVEDDAASLRLLSQILSTLGIPTLSAQTVKDAQRVDAGSLTCVIADMHLSDGTGMDLLEHFRKENPALKVFCLSGDGATGDYLNGFDLRLVKPVDVQELRRAIRSVI